MLPATEALKISAGVFIIPLGHGRFSISAPARRAVFIGNRAAVNLLMDLERGCFDHIAEPTDILMEFLRRMEIVDAVPGNLSITTCRDDSGSTQLTLFMTGNRIHAR